MEIKDFPPELVITLIKDETFITFIVKQRMEKIKSFCAMLMNDPILHILTTCFNDKLARF